MLALSLCMLLDSDRATKTCMDLLPTAAAWSKLHSGLGSLQYATADFGLMGKSPPFGGPHLST